MMCRVDYTTLPTPAHKPEPFRDVPGHKKSAPYTPTRFPHSPVHRNAITWHFTLAHRHFHRNTIPPDRFPRHQTDLCIHIHLALPATTANHHAQRRHTTTTHHEPTRVSPTVASSTRLYVTMPLPKLRSQRAAANYTTGDPPA
eukprot:jgi/Psemu1/1177/gm1.1177_g